MSSVPKPSRDDIRRGTAPESATAEEVAAALQTPPPVDSARPVSDALNLDDQQFASPTVIDLDTLPMPVSSSDAATIADPASPGQESSRQTSNGQSLLFPGTLLADRYDITALLGEGGMGAVYKAHDRELNRAVALKVIRPELARNQFIVDRFKQELLLAHQVTHKNVIRIYDLGESDGLRFITMEFIEGEDLRGLLLRKQKLPPEEAVDIMEQVCRALEAAHTAGVIHRDLKPQNIMRDKKGRVLVMDFGLARTLNGDGMTKAGALIGTMDYMSPEQALGKPLDERSDVFAIGLIFYELLTGKMPYRADSAVASLLKRTQERAIPVSTHDSSIPPALSNIVGKCLDPDLTLRYQNVRQILDELEAWQGGRAAATLKFPASQRPWAQTIQWHWIGVAAAVLVLGLVAYFFKDKLHNAGVPAGRSASASGPVSVLVADFQNDTSDTIFDGTLEPMFSVALQGASFINAFNRGSARQIAEKLPNPTSKLDEQSARLVAVSEGISVVVTGSLSYRGGEYHISVRAIDAVTGKTLVTDDISAPDKDQLLLDVAKLAAPIRKALGDTTPESVQLAASQGTFKVSNLEAAHQYSIGMEQQAAGKLEDALQSFSKAVELDPNFARAYAAMAAAAGNLGQDQNAEKYAKLALQHVDRMTERERYFVRGLYYVSSANWQKCVEEYTDLVKRYPADQFGENNLATCYAELHNMSKAMEAGQRALQLAPKDAEARLNFALYSCYATAFDSCQEEAGKVFELNPKYEEAFLALAYAETGKNQLSQAKETYQRLGKVSSWGSSLAASGLANLALYEGDFRGAVQILEKGAADDMLAKKPDAAADKFAMLAYTQLQRGDVRAASSAAAKAIELSRSVKIRLLAARTFAAIGESAKARTIAQNLASELGTESQSYAKLVLGEIALKQHDAKAAVQLFSGAVDLLDTWIGRFGLGRAYLEAGAFAEADSEFDRCIQRRGEALELFMDDMPTFSYFPETYYFEGRVREGLKSSEFGDFFRKYLDIRGKSTEDPLVTDIRHRQGA